MGISSFISLSNTHTVRAFYRFKSFVSKRITNLSRKVMLLEVTVEFKPRFVLLLTPIYNLPAPSKKEKGKGKKKGKEKQIRSIFLYLIM